MSVCQKGFLIFRDYCKRAIRATQKTILGSFGIDEEDEYGTFWFE